MRSRILQLKQEIAELDQKLVNSCTMKSDYSLPIQPFAIKKDSEREEILHRLNSLRVSTSGKTETLQTELLEISNKLRQLGLKKQAEYNSVKNARDMINQKISAHNKTLQKSYEEYQTLSTTVAKKQKIKEDSTMAKAKAYEESLQPLEKEAEKLCSEKEALSEEQTKLQEQLQIHENLYVMCKEDMLSRYTQRAEYIGQREELEAVLEAFEIVNVDELEFLVQEDFMQNHNSINTIKGKFKENLSVLDNAIENNRILIETLEKKYGKVVCDIEGLLTNAPGYRGSAEILMMEKVINEKTAEYDLDTLENVILDLNTLERFDIDEEILRLQLAEVIKAENKLKFDFEYEEKEMLEKIRVSYSENKVQNCNILSKENELNYKRNQYRNRLAAINQWKEEVEAVISRTISNIQVVVQDRTLIEEFCASLGRVSSSSIKQQIRNLLEAYSTKVLTRDKIIQNALPEIKKKFNERAQLATAMLKSQQEKAKLQNEKCRLAKELTLTMQKELNAKTVKSDKNVGNIKEQAYYMRNSLIKLEKIVTNEGKMYEKTNLQLQEISLNSKNIKKRLANIRYSINKITSEEHSLHFQIEKILENKRKDMLSSLQELSALNKESDELKLNELKEKIDDLTTQVEILNKELNRVDSDNITNLSVMKQEESILKTQMQVIESALRNVDIENKRIKEMETQLAKMEEAEAAPTPECLQDKSRGKRLRVYTGMRIIR